MRIRFKYIIPCIFLFISCEEFLIQDTNDDTNKNAFDKCWNTVNDVYPHLGYKGIDWNSLYHDYLPMAENAEGAEIYDVLLNILSELKDGHVDLIISGKGTGTFIPPRCIKDQDAFSFDLVKQLLNDNFQSTDNVHYKIIENNIGYAYIPSFIELFINELDVMMTHFSNTDGLILDIRHNGGGNEFNGLHLMSMFINKPAPLPVFYLDHEPVIPPDQQPHSNIYYNKPVVLLINGKCFSAAEGTSNFLSYPENITLIGDTTAGASGNPRIYDISLKMQIRIPRTDYRRYDGIQVEWNGILPDILVPQSKEDIQNNKDPQLAFAIKYLEDITLQ